MIKEITILGAGLLIGYLLFKKNGLADIGDHIKPGDKGSDIEGMQRLFEKVGNLKFDKYGQYDSDTKAAAIYLLEGTSALKDTSGNIDAVFVNDLSKMYANSLI